MKRYLLSIDDGGTYIKAAVYDFLGKQVALTRERNEMLMPRADWSEYDQQRLWEINCKCIRNLMEQTKISGAEIACIGISGQGSGYYAVGKNGENIRNAISSSDGRAKQIAEKWNADGTTETVYNNTYHAASAGQLTTILAWMKQNEPDTYAKIECLFSMKDFLVYRFTGNVISSYGCQSASGLMDVKNYSFTEELAKHFGLDSITAKFGKPRWGH